MASGSHRTEFFAVVREFQPLVRALGWTHSESVFTDDRIKVWRSITERENCVLEVPIVGGGKIRWHIKRDKKQMKYSVTEEAVALQLMNERDIPTVTLVAVGRHQDGRGFLITEHLGGYEDSEKLVEKGMDFEKLLEPSAQLAAKLHNSDLHHRDLYLCHFFARPKDPTDMRLIDVGRVRVFPRLFRRRWIIKDLGAFWFSTIRLGVTDKQREKWLRRYCTLRKIELSGVLKSVIAKADAIRKHDARLRKKEPGRNIAIEP